MVSHALCFCSLRQRSVQQLSSIWRLLHNLNFTSSYLRRSLFALFKDAERAKWGAAPANVHFQRTMNGQYAPSRVHRARPSLWRRPVLCSALGFTSPPESNTFFALARIQDWDGHGQERLPRRHIALWQGLAMVPLHSNSPPQLTQLGYLTAARVPACQLNAICSLSVVI